MSYIISSGVTSSGITLNTNNSIFVSSGGALKDTTVYSSATIYVSRGGTADNTTLDGYLARMEVYSEGTATGTALKNKGYFYVYPGAFVNSTRVSKGEFNLAGGIADNSFVESGGNINLHGGTATNIVVSQGGNIRMMVSSGAYYQGTSDGSAFEMKDASISGFVINADNYLWVESGGTAVSPKLTGDYGYLIVYSGGTALDVDWTPCVGSIGIVEGAYVTYASQYSGAYLGSEGTLLSHVQCLESETLGTFMSMCIMSGGTAQNTILRDYGHAYVSNGGMVFNTTLNDGGLHISSGGMASATTINKCTHSARGFHVSSGGTAENTTVNSAGYFHVTKGGTAKDTTVNSGGYFFISSGGTMTGQTTIGNGAVVSTYAGGIIDFNISYLEPDAEAGARINNLSLVRGVPTYTLTVSEQQKLGVYLLADGAVSIDGGIDVLNASGESFGTLVPGSLIKVGQICYSLNLTDSILSVTTWEPEPGLTPPTVYNVEVDITEPTPFAVTVTASFSDDVAVASTLYKIGMNGKWTLYDENGVTLFQNATVYFKAIDTDGYESEIVSCVVENIDKNIPISGMVLTNMSWVIESGLTYLDTTVNSGGVLYISSGGTANSTTLNSGGIIWVSGGIANSTTVNDTDGFYVESGGTANFTEINAGGYMYVDEGSANYTTVKENAEFHVFGSADNVVAQSGCWFCVYNGASATNITIEEGAGFSFEVAPDIYVQWTSGGSSFEIKGGNVSGFTFENGGGIDTKEGAIATDTTLNGEGSLDVARGGLASNTIVNAWGHLLTRPGGTVKDVTVNSRGYLRVSSGGTMTGQINIASGADLNVSNGAVLNFDITELKPGTGARVNDLSLLQGKQRQIIYTLTVSDRQMSGLYSLAEGTGSFKSTISVVNTGGSKLGSLTLGDTINVGEYSYTLNLIGETLQLDVVGPDLDLTAPAVSNIQESITSLTNQDVVLTADFADDVELAESLYKLGEKGEWTAYVDGVTVTENTTVYFKAIDAAGNESEVVSYTVSNIDKGAPSTPSVLDTVVSGQKVALVWNASTDDNSGIKEYVVTYSLDGQDYTVRTINTNYVLNNADFGSYSWSVQAVDFAGNESAVVAGDAFTVSGFKPYTVEYSADNFEHVITFAVTTPSLDAFRMPAGTYQLRVKQDGSSEWMTGDSIVAPESDIEPQLIKSDADGNADVFFANAVGTWESGYLAQHVGSTADTWGGTKEYATLFGKNKLADIIEGSTDANILLMTDDDNGDTLFVDDIYTASPGDVAEKQSRIAQIDEIRAGAGADVVDMTSQRFEYTGDGLTIRGGEGNDTIWANKGDNFLFGDAGNDRIVGASGNDVIAGGIGNDRLHGGGGEDVFTFCDNWGVDNVEQLETGTVTLWFVEGNIDKWDAETLTYTDGENSIKVNGIATDKITLKFGDDGSERFATLSGMGAFFDATTERVFEESAKGILASL